MDLLDGGTVDGLVCSQVECGVLERYKGQEHKLLAFFLPSLHHQALLLLQDVITSLGEGTDCYFDTLGDLLTSVVQASKAGAKSRPVWCSGGQQTRVVAYAVLAELVRTSRGRHTPSAALVTMVLSDVSPKEEEVKLQVRERGVGWTQREREMGEVWYEIVGEAVLWRIMEEGVGRKR
ncbi:hypothetical protein E2C01_067697 [Portunus trituberculatus]|uniref:Uncharacterized protein n=1 Tax=Portunus trituberculatus TaxID=210409 RepID=A0A5B7HLQ6_PORTR|nr:hypothetical protein [Portunus trituberculatus]